MSFLIEDSWIDLIMLEGKLYQKVLINISPKTNVGDMVITVMFLSRLNLLLTGMKKKMINHIINEVLFVIMSSCLTC